MKNRNIWKIIFYTILILCISTFSYFPKSYSKYIKEEEPVKFHVELEKLYIGYLEKLAPRSTSTYKEANYIVRFNRSQVMKNSDESQYVYIEIEQSCNITNVSSNGKITIDGNKATIKYTNAQTDTVSVSYKCNVADITTVDNNLEVLYTNVYIYEKFMPENIKYLYAKAEGNKILLTDYYTLYPLPTAEISEDGKTLTIPSLIEDKYTEFTTWLNLYGTSLNNQYDLAIDSYITSIYNSQDDILDLTKKLKGLSVTYDSNNESYIYQLDDNFLGYARTYYNHAVFSNFTKVVFSNSNLTDLEANEILKYYFSTYSTYTTEDIEKIITYVSKYGSINYMLAANDNGTRNQISGFVYLTDTGEIGIQTSLMNYVDAYINQEITIEFASNIKMFNIFTNALPSTYSFLTDELITILNNNVKIANSIVKNNQSVTTKIVYNEYFTVQDPTTKKYILVNVSSDGISNTIVKIVELTVVDTLTITQNGNNLNISITADNQDTTLAKTAIINMITSLDSYFITNYKDEIVDELFTSSTTVGNMTSLINENNITISYTYAITE